MMMIFFVSLLFFLLLFFFVVVVVVAGGGAPVVSNIFTHIYVGSKLFFKRVRIVRSNTERTVSKRGVGCCRA